MRICLYQPDIAANVGSIIRLCACFGVDLEVIEPCGFPFDAKRVSRAAMDYIDHVKLNRHASWDAFQQIRSNASRLVLLTTRAAAPYQEFSFSAEDCLLFGSESAGVPEDVHAAADARIMIPLRPQTRSFNIAQAAAIALAEGLRQTHQFPRRIQ